MSLIPDLVNEDLENSVYFQQQVTNKVMAEEQIVEENFTPMVEDEEVDHMSEVLQESDVEHFEEKKEELAEVEVQVPLAAEEDEEEEEQVEEVKEEPVQEEHLQEEPAHEEPIQEDPVQEEPVEEEEPKQEEEELPPAPAPVAAPIAVTPEPTPAPIEIMSTQNENENPNEVLNPKRLETNIWPPRACSAVGDMKAKVSSEEILPKKKINDLIARFNSGNIENDSPKKSDHEYKSEYGATKSVGKIHTDVFQ